MTTNTREQILASVDSMNDVIQESQFEVLCSLLDSIDKASTIMENYNGSGDLESFAIFQEADAAVAEGKPNGEVNAEAKKQNIFQKLWNFIKGIISSIGNFFKKAWSGAVVPTVEKIAPEKESTLSKILNAANPAEFVKEHGAELGVAAGAILAIATAIGVFKKDDILATVTKWWETVKLFFTNIKQLKEFTFGPTGIKTNIEILGIRGFLKESVNILKSAKTLASQNQKASDVLSNIQKQAEDLANKPILGDDVKEFDYFTIANELKEHINEIKNAADLDKTPEFAGGTNEGDISEEDAKKVTGILARLGKAAGATSNFFKGILDKIKSLEIVKKLLGEKTETPEGESAEQANAEQSAEQSAETAASTEQPAEEPKTEENKELSADEEENIINNIGVNESAKEEVPEDESVVSESVSHWYSR